jgi:multisubunit Na+/H+ antiporter MnhE subunit
MSFVWELGRLGFNFVKDLFASGWVTARIILRRGPLPRPGFVRLAYGELPAGAASFLGALVSLAPGTTTVDIDLERGELLLHLLDVEQADTTVAAIHSNFLQPIRTLFGVRT